MSLRCSQVIQLIKKLAPEYLAEDWDNVGLLVGSCDKEINRILISLDVNLDVVNEAIKKDIDLIISHHPIIFKPIKDLCTDRYQVKMLSKLLKKDISVYSSHTNLDSTINGVSDILAKKLGVKNLEVLYTTKEEKLFKLVVYIPKDCRNKLIDALGTAGAGHIGNYSHCTFSSAGVGTFKPGKNTKPFIGKKGKVEQVDEQRIETIISENQIDEIIKVVKENHPYEEIAYDLFPVNLKGKKLGLGRIGYFLKEKNIMEVIHLVKKELNVSSLKVVGNVNNYVKRIAVCGGSGSSLIKYAYKKGADLYITGDINYHEAQLAESLGLNVIDAGHWATEIPVIAFIRDYLIEELNTKQKVEIITSKVKTEPFSYY